MLQKNNLPSWPDFQLVDQPISSCFRIFPSNDGRESFCATLHYDTTIFALKEQKEEIQDLGKLFIAAPKMLEAILRFQNEWIFSGSLEDKANNKTIVLQFEAAIENIFKP